MCVIQDFVKSLDIYSTAKQTEHTVQFVYIGMATWHHVFANYLPYYYGTQGAWSCNGKGNANSSISSVVIIYLHCTLLGDYVLTPSKMPTKRLTWNEVCEMRSCSTFRSKPCSLLSRLSSEKVALRLSNGPK